MTRPETPAMTETDRSLLALAKTAQEAHAIMQRATIALAAQFKAVGGRAAYYETDDGDPDDVVGEVCEALSNARYCLECVVPLDGQGYCTDGCGYQAEE